ncbi:helix-turn-helix domain-containing protein [Lactobacillus mulieris]|uniref:helix-turn-helix domain-containing protein n=1 Tax=Lactobacillus mulieris TaxID=2508708 RepID=UPI00118EC6C5|nr:helix-turn-helix domain-containing protein [Lactobacillus mulieris]MCF1847657.1 helix-turn-helix domain-containing protein [Lactobacillus mulieris]TVU86128.1 helix-turn-helix domain-containing protein [Lactobacillus jensenii]
MDMCLGAVIRDRRKAMKLTQEDLAEFSGLSVNFISRIERTGDQNISIKKIVTELRKLSTFRAEKVCKAILSLVKEINEPTRTK